MRHPKHGELIVLAESPLSFHVHPVGDSDASFWLKRSELEPYNKPPTPTHLRPTRAPVASDLPWQAFLRKHGRIELVTHPEYVCKALTKIERETGVRYPKNDSAINVHENRWRAIALVCKWAKGTGVPDDLPSVKVGVDDSHYVITNTSFVMDLLRLGFPLGCGHVKESA